MTAPLVERVMATLWKREQYNGVGPDYDNYRKGARWDMGGRVESYEAEAREIIAAIPDAARLSEQAAEIERLREALQGLLVGVHGDGYVLPAGAVATRRARAALKDQDRG